MSLRRRVIPTLAFLLVLSPLLFRPTLADEYDDLEKAKQQTAEELSKKREEEGKTRQKQGTVGAKISETGSKILTLDEEVKSKEKEIRDLEATTKVRRESLEKKQEARDDLIRLFYKRGRVSALELFLTSRSFAELARLLGYYKATVTEYSREANLLNANVANLKVSLKSADLKRERLVGEVKSLAVQKKGLETELSNLNSYLNTLTSQITGLEGAIAGISAKQEEYIRRKLSATAQFTSVGEIEQARQTLTNPPFFPAFAVVSIGYPHRVGLNQYGAYGRAKSGQDAFSILRSYYNNIEIKEDYEVPETIEVVGYGRIPFEDLYLKGIAEMPSSWGDKGGFEALKAQAIAARSYALAVTENGRLPICASQACQVYIGGNKGGKWEEAVVSTRKDNRHGSVLLYNGQPIRAYYSSTFGGYSRLPTDFDVGWHSTFDYLKRIRDADGSGSAYDGPKYGDSPWYYRSWYSASDGHPWLTKEEMLDLLNSSLLPESENGNLSNPGNGGISFEEVRRRLESYGKTPLTDLTSLQPLFTDEGFTSLIRVNNGGAHTDVDGKRFRKVFILRSRGNLALWSSLYDIIQK